jgi:hypothetical protein
VLGRVAREDKVAIFTGLVAGKAGLVERFPVSFAVGELREPPGTLNLFALTEALTDITCAS